MFKKLFLRHDSFFPIVLLLFVIGVFLRFWQLDAFVTFLGDQGRDAIVIKRILTGEHFPAIGPVTSIGNLYLGPFYYYFIAPWLLLRWFDPIGLAYGVALISSAYILINYFLVSRLFNRYVGLISTALITFSYTLIDFSRFSWNPNLLPLFTLVTVYLFIQAYKTNKKIYFIFAGAFLAFCIQLHYLALFLGLAVVVFILKKLFENKKKWKEYLVNLLFCIGSFLFFSIPLIVFDLRHGGLNSRNFINLFLGSAAVAGNKMDNFISTGTYLSNYAIGNLTGTTSLIPFIVILLFATAMVLRKDKTNESDFFVFFLVSLLGISIYGGPKYPHYFGIIYPLFYIAVGRLISTLPAKAWNYFLVGVFFVCFIFLNSQKYYFIGSKGSYQIERAKRIAKVIHNNAGSSKYSLTAIPEVYSDHTSRYFLELWDKPPQAREAQIRTNELFVICETPCKPIGHPIYDIALFAPTKIVGKWNVDSIKIYKLTR